MRQGIHQLSVPARDPSRAGWVFLLLALVVGGALRFWALGDAPPGLYRDEAFNGLDALAVLDGDHALFFPANNGREPTYIYLTALAVALLGRTALAVRLAAAVIGTLTTGLIYRLGAAWFDRQTGVIAAWLWAITVWPVHLSRIGLRPVLLVPALALAFWLGHRAYRRGGRRRWALAGLALGATAYTYLAARLVPALILLWFVYLLLWHRETAWPRLRAGLPWYVAAAGLAALPLALVVLGQPGLVLGRAGQVSIFDPAVHGGDLAGTLWRNLWRGLGLFFWRGDTILRHNPPGRPLFDPVMAFAFMAGVIWCLRFWRRPAAAGVVLWAAVMLGPTVLAADAPHFLRAVGVLPAALLLAAIGLRRLLGPGAPAWRPLLVTGTLVVSLGLTARDYARYVAAPDTAYLFEAGARTLAETIAATPTETAVYLEQRLWEGWPSLAFVVGPERPVTRFRSAPELPQPVPAPAALFVWPHESLDYVPAWLAPPALVTAKIGALGRGDLEPVAYPLYVRYERLPPPPLPRLARFGDDLWLRAATVTADDDALQVSLVWSADRPIDRPLRVFTHVVDGAGRLVGQDDDAPAEGGWPVTWWQPGLLVGDEHRITLDAPYDLDRHRVIVGMYDPATLDRLPLATGGDAWTVP